MSTTLDIHATAAPANAAQDTRAALRFVTCGSVDDGKSTLIGRLLVDSKTVLQDQLAGVQRGGQTDLALLTDGLQAEREQGITIDVAYRYFNTAARKFIIADAPGHEQSTRNMVTAASSADAAVVLIDATKLDWQSTLPELLPQTRRHSLLVQLLRVPAIVFAVNKLDAVDDPALAFAYISAALQAFTQDAGITAQAIVPVSALVGYNVVDANPGWCGYQGPTLLALLEKLSATPADITQPFSFPVQWVEKFSSSADTTQGRRIFWGRIASGAVQVGQRMSVLPGGKSAVVAEVLDHARQPKTVWAGHSAGIILDRELDVSRGDVLLATDGFGDSPGKRNLTATVAWMDDEPLLPGRLYWALQGHRWVKAKVQRIVHQVNIQTLAQQPATQLDANAIGVVELVLQAPIAALPFAQSRILGSLVLVDTASHKTSGAALILSAHEG
jgi:sulfate adenylyltransferase subunit 1